MSGQNAASFALRLRAASARHQETVRRAFLRATEEVQRSVVEGSELTGAPGQPVDLGYLKGSFIPDFVSPLRWRLTTNAAYAPSIEDGVSYAHGGTPLTLRSPVGGFHSVKLTKAGWPRIVAQIASEVRRG
jgi:hypothetical protein